MFITSIRSVIVRWHEILIQKVVKTFLKPYKCTWIKHFCGNYSANISEMFFNVEMTFLCYLGNCILKFTWKTGANIFLCNRRLNKYMYHVELCDFYNSPIHFLMCNNCFSQGRCNRVFFIFYWLFITQRDG